MKKTLFLLLLLSLLLTASGCRRRTTTAAPIPQSVADTQPLGDDSPSRAAPQTSSPDADPDSETVENPDSPRREYDENAAAGIDFTAHHPIQGDGEGGGQPLSGGEARQTATQFDDEAPLPVTMTLPDDDAERIGTANDAQTAETATQYYTALLSSRLGKLFECQRLSVYWETGNDHVTIGKTSKEHALLLSAGAYNAASRRAEDMLTVDDGWIERKNPDAIVKVVPDSVLGGGVFLTESAQSIRHALLTRKALGGTGAIRKERVYLLSESLLQTPATRLAAAVYLASSMYPDLFGDVDAAEAARQLIDEAGLPSAGTFFYP